MAIGAEIICWSSGIGVARVLIFINPVIRMETDEEVKKPASAMARVGRIKKKVSLVELLQHMAANTSMVEDWDEPRISRLMVGHKPLKKVPGRSFIANVFISAIGKRIYAYGAEAAISEEIWKMRLKSVCLI